MNLNSLGINGIQNPVYYSTNFAQSSFTVQEVEEVYPGGKGTGAGP